MIMFVTIKKGVEIKIVLRRLKVRARKLKLYGVDVSLMR